MTWNHQIPIINLSNYIYISNFDFSAPNWLVECNRDIPGQQHPHSGHAAGAGHKPRGGMHSEHVHRIK